MDTSRKGKGGGSMTREAVVVEQSGVHETRNSSPLARRRLLLVGSHVVQYSSPIFQKLAQDPRLEILVAYCSMQGAEACVDPEFGVEVAWDTPLFEGYPWVHVPNRALRPGLGRVQFAKSEDPILLEAVAQEVPRTRNIWSGEGGSRQLQRKRRVP